MSGDSVAPGPNEAPLLPVVSHSRGNPKDSEWRYTVVDPIMDLKNEHFFKPEVNRRLDFLHIAVFLLEN